MLSFNTLIEPVLADNSLGAVPLTGVGGAAQFFTVALLFVLVLVLTYFTTRFVGSYQKKQLSGNNIQILDTLRFSGNKLIQIIKAGDKCFVVAVCKDTVTLLGEIDSDGLNIKEPALSGSESFAFLLNKFRRKEEGADEEKPQDGSRKDR